MFVKKKLNVIKLFSLLILSCSQSYLNQNYLIQIKIQDKLLPVNIKVQKDTLFVFNSDEVLKLELKKKEDIYTAFFDSYQNRLEFKIIDKKVEGFWIKVNKEKEDRFSFSGAKTYNNQRFLNTEIDTINIPSEWKVTFYHDDKIEPRSAFSPSDSQTNFPKLFSHQNFLKKSSATLSSLAFAYKNQKNCPLFYII